jgi:hypothetical protein
MHGGRAEGRCIDCTCCKQVGSGWDSKRSKDSDDVPVQPGNSLMGLRNWTHSNFLGRDAWEFVHRTMDFDIHSYARSCHHSCFHTNFEKNTERRLSTLRIRP